MPKYYERKDRAVPLTKSEIRTKFVIAQKFHGLVRAWTGDKWTLRIRDRIRGKTRYADRIVMLPTWALRLGRHYAMAYMIHEYSHIVARGHGHDQTFKNVEDRVLAEFGISITRAKCYVRTISVNGAEVYRDPRVKS